MIAAATAYERIVDKLRGRGGNVIVRGRQARAQCPAHDGHDLNLAVTDGGQQALLKCHSHDCDWRDILAALQLEPGDLFNEPRGATYRYDDGRLVHRTPDKKFRQAGNTKGTPQLWQLSQVQEAVHTGRVIYLVEGEKDAEALTILGATATTAPMGATNVGRCDFTPLTGARVVVIPDQDSAGIRWQQTVLEKLAGVDADIKIGTIREGKDAADHIAAGHGLDDISLSDSPTPSPPAGLRSLRITKAADIPPRGVRWVWKDRLALGSLALLGGREGIGKSTIAYTFAADLTRGRLPGVHHGTPRAVVVAATEDSWSHTIVPRLMAAGANLELVYRVDVITSEGTETGLILPKDIAAVEEAIQHTGAVMLLLDPLMSRLDGNLDSHKDADVRRALEPFSALADRTGALFLGIIHVNKSANTDPLTLLMGSRAFAAVARAVLFVMKDGEDETLRLLGQPKNNLGRNDLPMLTFRIEGQCVAETEEGQVWTSVISWQGERTGSVDEALGIAAGTSEERTAVGDAIAWLSDYLKSLGGTAPSADIKKGARADGHNDSALQRARGRLKIVVERAAIPQGPTYWSLPGTQPNPPTSDISRVNGQVRVGESDSLVSSLGESDRSEMSDSTAGQSVLSETTDKTGSFTYGTRGRPPARAREDPQLTLVPPICDDCGESIDSTFHAQTCEAS